MTGASHIGIDFGTTNSALAWAGDDGAPQVATFSLHGEATRTFRSLLYFEEDPPWVGGRPAPWVGPRAIEQYLATDGEGRLMQSMKTFLASRVVKGTTVLGHDFPLERLIALIVQGLWDGFVQGVAARREVTRPRTLVAGRPVRFAGSDGEEDDRHAEARLLTALAMAGFDEVELVLEPVAAALHYEAGLDHDETVLVADFGGGTSDFCVLRVGPSHRDAPAGRERIIGTRGVGVAGDDLDARIVRHVVAPALGRGSAYRSQSGNVLEIPPGIFDKLERWNELSFLRSRRNIDMLLGYARTAREPERVRALVHLVEHNLGHRLYRTVEAAKVRLSTEERAEIELVDGPLVVRGAIERAEFERWIQPELDALAACVDGLLGETGLAAGDIDTVFLTGGTGQVPAVRRLFAARFGEGRLRTGDFLTSIASGLALHARRRARRP